VERRSPAPQVVVVHRREVIVNEAEGVDEFDGDAGAEGV
jgi:hypothetical protein